MRLVTRNDTSLAVGLIVGVIVVFQQPLHFVLDVARDVETRYNVDLVPALTIMAGVFIFHQYRKRQLSKAEAILASTEAARARVRSEELERLMRFSQALANALDIPTLQQVLSRNLPAFARERTFWVLARAGGRWQEILQDPTRAPKRSLDVLEPRADRAIAAGPSAEGHVEGSQGSETTCFAMHAGGEPIGVLGLQDTGTLRPVERAAVGAAAGLIAIALRNVQLFHETLEHSVRDRLTGCFNREYCLEMLDLELRRARRSRRPLAILMFDVDNFKTINDELGHLKGDEILRAVGAQLARLLRSTDVSCRYGGDEFLIILPDTHLAGAEQVAETLRREIAILAIAGTGTQVLPVNISVGVAVAAPAETDVGGFISRTDEALYRAKRAGRDRVCLATTAAAAPGDLEIQEPAAAGVRGATGGGGGTETILVAEDEPLTRELIRRWLEPLGYTILLAGNGADALAIAEAHRGPIHLLLSDIVMPDLDGRELARLMKNLKPDIRTLFVSGFLGYAAADPAVMGGEAVVLPKPFTCAALLASVREQLDVWPAS